MIGTTQPNTFSVTETSVKEQILHYVCCEVPDDFAGVTTTFCGLSIMTDCVSTGFSACAQCVEVAKRPGCPLGKDCYPEY